MTRLTPNSEPQGRAADCFYVLAEYGGCGTTRDLHGWLASEGETYTYEQVHSAVRGLARRKLIEEAVPGSRFPPRGTLWRVTGYGREMLRVWCGDDEQPVRVPCGLGWP